MKKKDAIKIDKKVTLLFLKVNSEYVESKISEVNKEDVVVKANALGVAHTFRIPMTNLTLGLNSIYADAGSPIKN